MMTQISVKSHYGLALGAFLTVENAFGAIYSNMGKLDECILNLQRSERQNIGS